ncbi:hypothetical protein [Gemmatimonas sp.]|uniref:hypothetical protein n=1 Tax=Gemmatimonas sp. TaxID=1962908 RepID=UPI003F7249FD
MCHVQLLRHAFRLASGARVALVGGLLGVVACSASDTARARTSDPAATTPAMAPSGEGPALRIEQLWQTDAEASFSYIVDLDVDRHGAVYVADADPFSVTVISPRGRVLRTIGRPGAGPGEFRGIGNVQAGEGDTLFVFDNVLQRINAFRSGDDSVVYSRTVTDQGSGSPEQVYRIGATSQLLATYMAPVRAEASDAQFADRRMVVRVLGADGTPVRDSLLTGVGRSNLFRRSRMGSMISVGTNVFGRQPIVRFSTGKRVVYARTDTVAVMVVALDGTATRRCAMTTSTVPVRPEDLARERERTSARLRDVLSDSMPVAWPPLADVVVDEHDGVWLGLTGAGGQPDRWVWCDADGVVRGTVRFSADMRLAAVRANHLYIIGSDENQVPSVYAFRLLDTLAAERGRGRK